MLVPDESLAHGQLWHEKRREYAVYGYGAATEVHVDTTPSIRHVDAAPPNILYSTPQTYSYEAIQHNTICNQSNSVCAYDTDKLHSQQERAESHGDPDLNQDIATNVGPRMLPDGTYEIPQQWCPVREHHELVTEAAANSIIAPPAASSAFATDDPPVANEDMAGLFELWLSSSTAGNTASQNSTHSDAEMMHLFDFEAYSSGERGNVYSQAGRHDFDSLRSMKSSPEMRDLMGQSPPRRLARQTSDLTVMSSKVVTAFDMYNEPAAPTDVFGIPFATHDGRVYTRPNGSSFLDVPTAPDYGHFRNSGGSFETVRESAEQLMNYGSCWNAISQPPTSSSAIQIGFSKSYEAPSVNDDGTTPTGFRAMCPEPFDATISASENNTFITVEPPAAPSQDATTPEPPCNSAESNAYGYHFDDSLAPFWARMGDDPTPKDEHDLLGGQGGVVQPQPHHASGPHHRVLSDIERPLPLRRKTSRYFSNPPSLEAPSGYPSSPTPTVESLPTPTPMEGLGTTEVVMGSTGEMQTREREAGARAHPCQLCDQSYTRKFSLEDHMNAAHHKTKPHLCRLAPDKCQEGFAWRGDRSRHEKVYCEFRTIYKAAVKGIQNALTRDKSPSR